VSSECDAGAELIDRSGGTGSVMCSCRARYVVVVVIIIIIAPAPIIAGGHEYWLSQV